MPNKLDKTQENELMLLHEPAAVYQTATAQTTLSNNIPFHGIIAQEIFIRLFVIQKFHVYLPKNFNMATILLEYDAKSSIAEKGLDFLLSLGMFKVKEVSEKSPYNEEFVAKIKRSENSEGVKIKTEDLWK